MILVIVTGCWGLLMWIGENYKLCTCDLTEYFLRMSIPMKKSMGFQVPV